MRDQGGNSLAPYIWSVAGHGESNRTMKGELEELGEEVDETVDSISKVQTQILNLTGGKVNIFNDKGEFRDYYTIMKEISEVYNELSSTNQASLREILFGKQRGNQGAALIQAFQSGQIENAYKTAMNSAGSAYAENEKWLDSIEAKQQKIAATFESISLDFLNSDTVKGALDLFNGLLKVIDGLGAEFTTLSTVGIGLFIKSLV